MDTLTVEARMAHPATAVPAAMEALQGLSTAARKAGVRRETALLVQLRASQINGCSFCCEMHARELRGGGCSEERIATGAAWREAPYFTAAERAALALTEAATRLADRPEPVPDDVYAAAAEHYDEQELAGLSLEIAAINVWNR